MVPLLFAGFPGLFADRTRGHRLDGRADEKHDRTRACGSPRVTCSVGLAEISGPARNVWTSLGLAHARRPRRLQTRRALLLLLQRRPLGERNVWRRLRSRRQGTRTVL